MTTTTVYKLTDEHGQTYNRTNWGLGVEHSGTGKGELCGPDWIHVYDDPLVAVFLNPMHANFKNPRLWRAEAWGKHLDDNGLKSGWQHVRTVEELPVPEVTTEQRARFAILCALEVTRDETWTKWARGWIDGSGRFYAAVDRRSAEVARAAVAEAERAAEEVAWAAATTRLARAVARAAARSAEELWAADVTWAAARSARAVAWAAEVAVLDLPALARQAMST